MIKPARERAIITLETGEEINLDNLKINESIQIGDITVVKNSQGQVSYINSKTGEPQMNSIRIPKASIYTVTLSDGSKVTLNSESKLTYPSVFKNGDRTVVLEGEGYFEIEHTPNKDRFIVQTEQQEVEVLGTKFNIKASDRENTTFTTLASGSVKVNSRSKPEHQVIKPGQQAYSARNGSLAIQAVDLEKVLGWTNGQFIFDGTNNKETFDEIARWYDVDIQHQANSRNNEYIGKIPRHLTLDKLISLMNYAEIDIQARIDKNNRIKLLIN
ncbi:MAG: FecR family protein [Sphingobacterium hotanense]